MLYLDASALVKRYVEEGSEAVRVAMAAESAWWTCRIGFVETVRAVGLASGAGAVRAVKREWAIIRRRRDRRGIGGSRRDARALRRAAQPRRAAPGRRAAPRERRPDPGHLGRPAPRRRARPGPAHPARSARLTQISASRGVTRVVIPRGITTTAQAAIRKPLSRSGIRPRLKSRGAQGPAGPRDGFSVITQVSGAGATPATTSPWAAPPGW